MAIGLKWLGASGRPIKRLPAALRILLALLSAVVVIAAGHRIPFNLSLDSFTHPDNAVFGVAAGTLLSRTAMPATPVTVVDIDDKTFDDWGQPAVMPRDRLFRLVDAVAVRRASAIVLDVDLTFAVTEGEIDAVTGHLAAYRAKAPAPPLLLVRRLWPVPPQPDKHTTVRLPRYGGALAEALKRLDREVDESPTAMWVSSLFARDSDRIVRRWRNLESACGNESGDGRAQLIASAALAVRLLAAQPGGGVPELKRELGVLSGHHCREGQSLPDKWGAPRAMRRVPYLFGWRGGDPAGMAIAAQGGRGVLLFERLSAFDVLDYAGKPAARSDDCVPGSLLGCEPFENRVVVIGTSHRDSDDMHDTPFGRMPGVVLVANTIAGAGASEAAFASAWTIRLAALALLAVVLALFELPLIYSSIGIGALLAVSGLVAYARLGNVILAYEVASLCLSIATLFLLFAALVTLVRHVWMPIAKLLDKTGTAA